jgi:DNA-binding HxlR family transcriptional regulator
MPAPLEPEAVPNLRELVNHPHVVEVLDALTHGPLTFADLRSRVRTGRRGLTAALRIVGARGLVTKSDNGSWDADPPADAVYRHTDLGRQVVEELSKFSVWTAICAGIDFLPVRPGPSPERRPPEAGVDDC